MNEESFLNDLYNAPRKDVEVFDDVNDAVDLWQNMFSNIIDKHIPKKSKRIKANPTPWFNRDIKRHLSTRDYLHRKALKSNNSSDWVDFKAYRNKVTNIIRKAKEDYCKQTVSSCSGDSKKMWKALNEFVPKKASPSPTFIIIDDQVCNNNKDISNGFNKHFTSVASKLINGNDITDVHVQPKSITCESSNVHLCLPKISPEFLSREIDQMSVNKATGLDDVSCKILKLAKPAIVDSLTYLMNMSLSTGIFPCAWKETKIIPLHKGGDVSDSNNYRPIAILPVVSKIIEKAVHKHVYSYVSKHNLLSKHQSGFRPFHSTETCLIDMVNEWVYNMNSGSMTGVVLIDLRKAFDTVNHDILLTKLQDIGASGLTLKWFKSYLSGRYQKVSFKDSLSDALEVSTGVPQGSILGPLLFILFIDSMSKVTSHGKISMYADDTTLSVKGTDAREISRKLTSDLNAIVKWLKDNKLFLNTDKTNIMLLGTGAKLRNVLSTDFSVVINGKELERVKKAKCLGVLIDEELNWHNQVNKVIQNVFCKIAVVRRLKPYLNIDTLNVLFKSFVQPLFDYCTIVWYGRFKDDCSKLDILHKRCARVILGVNYLTSSNFMFNMLGWERLQKRNDYFKALMMYKALNGIAPEYISNMFKYVSATHNRQTRQATAGQLALPPTCNSYDLECFKSSFVYNGVKLWNDLDVQIRNSVNMQVFKCQYKSTYFTCFKN